MKKYFFGVFICLLIFLSTGCKQSIVGKWKSIDTDNDFYYIFNQDKTCSYVMLAARLHCTYEIDDEKINILYEGNDTTTTFNYRFEENSLIIQNDNGKDTKFEKVN